MRSRALAVRQSRGFCGISHASPPSSPPQEQEVARSSGCARRREGGRKGGREGGHLPRKVVIMDRKHRYVSRKRVVSWLPLDSLDVCPGRNWQGKFAKENSSHIADFCPRWEGGAVEMLEPWRVAPRFAVHQGPSAAPFPLLRQTFRSMPSRSSPPRPTSPSRAAT